MKINGDPNGIRTADALQIDQADAASRPFCLDHAALDKALAHQLVNLAARQSEVIACIRNPAPLQLVVFGLTVAVFHRESTMPAAPERIRRWLRHANDIGQRANDRFRARGTRRTTRHCERMAGS